MNNKLRAVALAVMAAVGVGIVGPTAAVEASGKGRRNTAYGLGAVAAYGVIKKKPLIAGLAGGGAIYSYMKGQEEDRKARDRRRLQSRRTYYYKRKNGKLVRYARYR